MPLHELIPPPGMHFSPHSFGAGSGHKRVMDFLYIYDIIVNMYRNNVTVQLELFDSEVTLTLETNIH